MHLKKPVPPLVTSGIVKPPILTSFLSSSGMRASMLHGGRLPISRPRPHPRALQPGKVQASEQERDPRTRFAITISEAILTQI